MLYSCHQTYRLDAFISIMFHLADDAFLYRFFADYQISNRSMTSIDHLVIYIEILRKDLLILNLGVLYLFCLD